MHKFATVYKAAMRKVADANTDYVDSIRRQPGEVVSFDDLARAKARQSYVNVIGPGFPARLREVYVENYPEMWAKQRDKINKSTTPADYLREEYPAIRPAKRPAYRRALNEEKAKLQAQPKATTWSQLGAGIKDYMKDPIKTIRWAWTSPATKGAPAEIGLREALRALNPNSTTK